METTTQPHRQMLRRMCTLGRVAGWAMIAIGVFGVGAIAHASQVVPQFGMQDIFSGSVDAASQILTGLLVLGTVQFIRYVVEEGTEPRWLLRNGHIILCLFALSLLLTWGLRNWPHLWKNLELIFALSPEHMIPMGRPLAVALITFTAVLPAVTKALCVLGIAAILRTVLPVMAESKTLA